MQPEKVAFLAQTYQARNRNIPFKFTFEQWRAWWEDNLGPDWFQKRGCHRDQYVMARKRDKGPYALWNVKCITASDNAGEMKINGSLSFGERHWNVKITESTAISIRKASGTLASIAAEYGVEKGTVRTIKNGYSWPHLVGVIESTPFIPLRKMHKRMTAKDARAIFISKKDINELAVRYGVTRCNILTIKRRASWREATKDLPSPPFVGYLGRVQPKVRP